MTKKSGVTKSQKQDLAKVIKQMDSWIQHETKLNLLISTPLVHLMLFGRLVTRLEEEGLFLFDAHGEFCRVPLIPEQYNCSLSSQKCSVSVTLKDDSAGKLRLAEDIRGTEQRGEEEGPQDYQPREESVPGAQDVNCEQE
jgi:hypothetical protein